MLFMSPAVINLKIVERKRTMKKIWLLVILMLALYPQVIFAGTDPLSESGSPWYVGVGAEVDQPLTGWDTGNYLGLGGSLFGGYSIEGPWVAQVNVDQLIFSGGGNSLYNARFLAQAKYTFGGEKLQPYLLAGPGLVFQAISPGSFSTVNLTLVLGAGVQFDLGGPYHLFVEAKDHFIFPQGSIQMDIPITAGVWTNL
jgi:hypothetical protein